MEPIIHIQNLNKFYGSKHVLKDISIDIEPGQVIGYIGPNGAGKSTTVKILAGLLSDFSGDVFVKGIDIRKDPVAVKSLIGFVPELAELYDVLTPNEFLSLIGSLYNLHEEVVAERANRMLDAFGLAGNMNQRMDTFSKGMKQKVLITSGLLHNPEIIILDEPLSGLDANSVIIVKEIIDKLAKNGKTIFYCSHMMDVVEKVSDRIILIDQGRVVADGTIDELRQLQNKDSLEDIFAGLTATESMHEASEKLLNAFD
ncbi:ABC transporter ATP-binding protein [Paludibacter sp.]|uniref:ABC transporter ATP-binding protein n=1 Tax=Paludibacter sp. TaxID=1898105 RepID=UPI0013545F70|nr:ABC transporter ATP-binding protein [Paludibacter sp.]MTK51868.1 ABC transporter ATP-binding protein [Paludibacter sp.]